MVVSVPPLPLLAGAPVGSLTSLVAMYSCQFAGLRAKRHLFRLVVGEIAHHWKERQQLPWVTTSAPDFGCCRLHQNITMMAASRAQYKRVLEY